MSGRELLRLPDRDKQAMNQSECGQLHEVSPKAVKDQWAYTQAMLGSGS